MCSTIDGTFPDKYAFYDKDGRSFRTEFASTDRQFSIVLFERTNQLKYENCFARGLFDNLDRLAQVIKLWASDKDDVESIKLKLDELEQYQDFDFKHSNSDIDKAWTKVKNMFFNDTGFWKDPDWNDRYLELLTAAKRHNSLQTYFPFTSHYCLRFSVDKEIKETWTLDLYIIPTAYSEEIKEGSGKFYVSYNEKPMGGQLFDNVKDAIDFYVEKLKETDPIKWVTV